MTIVRVNKDLPLPEYQTPQAAGMDLYANIDGNVTVKSGGTALIPTGIRVRLPPNHEMQIRPRSGLAAKYGITVLNTPGTIDEDYRGEVGVILINHGESDFLVQKGDRIAQAVIAAVARPQITEADCLDDTERGEGGFGHTGV
jgi:dUTP pyrophosphatase